MNNTNLIYQKLYNENLPFPYPPLYIEDNTDYICFCTSSNISSKFWKICQIDNFSSLNIQKIFHSYQNIKELLPNQLLIGPLFHENNSKLPPFIPIPSFYELSDLSFDEKSFIPTKDLSGNYIFKKNPIYTDGIYNGRALLLTIGVPVSNQIKTIERCLSHIQPILEQLDAELLVIDTGSTDGTIEVCKNYHARILSFPWCNNMSAARNEGIYHALGLWYLSIDDDEWFENTDEIIQFFKSGLYQFYDSASYIQRNYHKSSGETYSDHNATRMARITPELHFEGRIHDALMLPTMSRHYQLSCYAHHYGFIHNKDNRLDKYQRNASLLLYDVSEYPDNLRYSYQLAKEFHVMGYYKEATAYYLRGISIGKEYSNSFHEKQHILYLFASLTEQKNELLFPFMDLLLKTSYSFTLLELAFLAYNKAALGIQLNKTPDEVLSYINSYRKYCDLYAQSTAPDMLRTAISVNVCDNIEYVINSHVIAFCAYCQKTENNAALFELEFLQPERIHLFKRIFCSCFIKASDCIYDKVLKKLSSSDIINWNKDILYAFLQSFEHDSIRATCLVRFCNILPYYTIPLLEHYLTFQFEDDISPEAQSYLSNVALSLNLTDITLQELYFFSSILYKAIGHSNNWNDNLFVFKHYILLTGKFVHLYYNPELLKQKNTTIIPPEHLAAYYIDCAINSKIDPLTNLQTAVLICPEFQEYINTFLDEFSLSTKPNLSFEQLFMQFKENISTLLSIGQKEEAYELLLELQSIEPNNIEIQKLLKIVSNK